MERSVSQSAQHRPGPVLRPVLHGPRRPRICARKVKAPLSRWNKHPEGKPRTTHRITSITAHVSAEHHQPATRRRKSVTNADEP